jgi:hypothetical protein
MQSPMMQTAAAVEGECVREHAGAGRHGVSPGRELKPFELIVCSHCDGSQQIS